MWSKLSAAQQDLLAPEVSFLAIVSYFSSDVMMETGRLVAYTVKQGVLVRGRFEFG